MKNRVLQVLIFVLMLSSCSAGIGKGPGSSIKKSESVEKIQRIKSNVHIGNWDVSGMSSEEARDLLRDMAYGLDVEPVNARLDEKTWKIVTYERNGKKFNIDKTLELAMNAGEGSIVEPFFDDVLPAVTAKELESKIIEIASSTTPLLNKQNSRMNNIEIASGKLDYLIIKPGEEFSFNSAVGQRNEEKGYEMAPVIIKTPDGYKEGFDIGGGICQISTTIYNAVEQCGMKITERHIHAKDVGYVPKGNDATVSYGSADLKFVNTRSKPVMLRIFIGKDDFTVKILENSN